jgi:predicted helicase
MGNSRHNNWHTYFDEMSINLRNHKKGKEFEVLTSNVLKNHPIYASKVKDVWILRDGAPKDLIKKLNLPSPDEGIDLIAKTYTGEYWAIQCKFKSSMHPPTMKELATFNNLANTHCKNISLAILFHTGERGVRKRYLMGKNYTEVGLEFWLGLTSDDWKRINAVSREKKYKPQKRLPKDHQQKAIKQAQDHFIKNNKHRGRLIMPCGTGKSLTAFWIANKLNAKSIIVAVPSLNLIKQSLEDWTAEFIAQNEYPLPEWQVVCSDETTGKLEDDFVSDVYSLGIPTTTNVDEITSFLRKQTKGRKVIFTTYQSSDRLTAAAQKAKFTFDLAILDEAHKTVGIKSKAFASLLSDKNISIKKRMFMTATERVLKGQNDDVLSMDDELVYGKRFYQLTFKNAIHSNPQIISDYKILTIAVSNTQIQELIQKNKILSDNKKKIEEQDAQSLAAAIALRQATKKYGIKHAISFHKSIKAAESFSSLNQRLNSTKVDKVSLSSYHISSKKSAGQRSQLLDDFKNDKLALMTNARCLTEGVNVPAIDCVLFADPKQSIVDIVQAAGRALRVSPGKKYGYIMIPLIVPDKLDLVEFSLSTSFGKITRIISALSTQDETLVEELRLLEQGKKSSSDNKIQLENIFTTAINFNIESLIKNLTTKIWEKVAKANLKDFFDAREIARSLKIEGYSEWLKFYKEGRVPLDIPLYPDQTYNGKGWVSWPDWLGNNSTEDNFNIGVKELKEYIKKYGNSYVPERYTTIDGFKLGQFCKMARQGTIIVNERINMLNQINGWVWDIEEDKFNKLYEALKKVSINNKGIPNKHLSIQKIKIGNYELSLGAWVFSLRSMYKKLNEGKLKPTKNKRLLRSKNDPRIKLLEKIPFWTWSAKPLMVEFDKGRKFIRSLKLKHRLAYTDWWVKNQSTLPFRLPKKPDESYKNYGWKGWSDFLGNK